MTDKNAKNENSKIRIMTFSRRLLFWSRSLF